MSKKLKVGVVGAGNIFKMAHAPVLAEHPEIEWIAICDLVPEKAEAVAGREGFLRACGRAARTN